MIRGFNITNISDEETLDKVLRKFNIGWSDDAIKSWLNGGCKNIGYFEEYDQYLWSINNKLPSSNDYVTADDVLTGNIL